MLGWDVFLAMSMDKLNQIFDAQYRSSAVNIPRHVQHTTTVKVTTPPVTLSVEANFYCSPARCEISTDNDKVKLIFDILEHDPNNPDNKSSFKETQIDPPTSDPSFESAVAPGTVFTAIVPIKVLQGAVKTFDAWFQLNEANPVNATYTFPVGGTSVSDATLAAAVSQIFIERAFRYKWFTIDQHPTSPTSPDLVPTNFNFNSYLNARGIGVLCLYIATTSAPPGTPNLSIRNPLPDTGGIDTMVLISNRIVVGILKAAFDSDGSFPWHMQLIRGTGDLGFDWIRSGGNAQVTVDVPPVANASFPSNQVIVPIHEKSDSSPGFAIASQSGQQDIVGSLSTTFEQKFTTRITRKTETSDFTVRFGAVPIQINVNKSDATNINLVYNFVGTSMNVEAVSSKAIDPQALQTIEGNFSDRFRMLMSIALAKANFVPVSTLLLQCIQFPDGNYIRLFGANQPGELVLWGNLIQ